MTGFSPCIFGREEGGLADAQSSLPAVTCRIIVECPISCSIRPARKARTVFICPVCRAGTCCPLPRLRHCARLKRAHLSCPVERHRLQTLSCREPGPPGPKALLNCAGLDRTGRQTCCQHNLYRYENICDIAAEKLKTNAPKKTPPASSDARFWRPFPC